MRSAISAFQSKDIHCMEGAFIAAAILGELGYPPLIVSFESVDLLDHVIFAYKRKNLWGAVGFSRDQGLKGRKPVFKSIRSLALSYYDPYVDQTGRIKAYQIANLDESKSNWRFSSRNVWKAENYLLDLPHVKLKSSNSRYRKLQKAYVKFGPMKPQRYWLY